MWRRAIISSLIFIAGLVIIDRAVGLLLRSALTKVKTGETVGLINRACDQSDAEIFIFGSSRAVHHIDPRVLTRELGYTAYNAGCDGQGILYGRMLQSLLLDRENSAKLFILHTEPRDLYRQDATRASMFAPYYGRNPDVDEILEGAGRFAGFKLQSWIYRYNSLIGPIVRNLSFPNEKGYDGFVPLDGTMQAHELEEQARRNAGETPPEIRPELIETYRDFIATAREHGVQVVLVTSPRFEHRDRGADDPEEHDAGPARTAYTALAREECVPYLAVDGTAHPSFQDPEFFRDRSHLNSRGSTLFTELLAREIRDQLPVTTLQYAERGEQ